jgi:hypothetical protein
MNSVPFPVEAPYRVKSDLVKLVPNLHGPVVFFDQNRAQYAAQKQVVITSADAVGKPVFQCMPHLSPTLVAQTVAEVSSVLGIDEAGEAFTSPDALALYLQDDWVVMGDGGGSSSNVCQMLHVCFPSGWRPEEKLGLSMRQIHQPVADGGKLLAASDALTTAMLAKGPFVRYVWTLAPEPNLRRHPDNAFRVPIGTTVSLDNIWFRCERQVTVPLPVSGRSLFLIRVFVAPLQEICATQERRQLLRESLASMSDATIAYKGISELRHAVLAGWATLAT